MPHLWHVFMLLHTAKTTSVGLISKPTYVQCSIAPSSQSCIWSPHARRRWSAQRHRLGAGRRQSSRRRSSAHRTGSGRSNAAQFCRRSACPWTTLLPQQGDVEWWSYWSDALGCLQKSMDVIIVSVNSVMLWVAPCYCHELLFLSHLFTGFRLLHSFHNQYFFV